MYVIDIFSKYAWVFPLKDKKGITITDAFRKIWMQTKQNMSWSRRRILQQIIEIMARKKWYIEKWKKKYSTHNEGKSAVAVRFIRILKNKIYKYMTYNIEKCISW